MYMNLWEEYTVTAGERPFIVGAIFSAQHGHIRGHLRTLNELDEVSEIHLCAIEGGELEEISAMSPTVKSGTRDRDAFLSKSRNTPFHGWELKGRAVYTIVGGVVVWQAGA